MTFETNNPLFVPVAAEEMQATTTTEEDPGEGFGKIYPAAQASQLEEDSDEDEDVPSDVISRKELDKGRLSRDGTLTYQITSLLLQHLINRQRQYTSHFTQTTTPLCLGSSDATI